MTKALQYTPGAGLGPIDTQLLLSASLRRSGEEMSADVKGVVTAAQAMQRVKEITKARDWLSFTETKKLLLDDCYAMLAKLKKQQDGNFADGAAVGAYLKTIKQITDMLDSANMENESSRREINDAHAQVMGMAIKVAFEMALMELQKRYPNIPEDEVYEILEKSLPLATTSLKESVELSHKQHNG